MVWRRVESGRKFPSSFQIDFGLNNFRRMWFSELRRSLVECGPWNSDMNRFPNFPFLLNIFISINGCVLFNCDSMLWMRAVWFRIAGRFIFSDSLQVCLNGPTTFFNRHTPYSHRIYREWFKKKRCFFICFSFVDFGPFSFECEGEWMFRLFIVVPDNMLMVYFAFAKHATWSQSRLSMAQYYRSVFLWFRYRQKVGVRCYCRAYWINRAHLRMYISST